MPVKEPDERASARVELRKAGKTTKRLIPKRASVEILTGSLLVPPSTQRPMHFVFLGNCQLLSLHHVFKRFVGRAERVEFAFVNAYETPTAEGFAQLRQADVVVLQQGQRAPTIGRENIPQGIPVHLVPSVNGSFLWPYHGVPHPLNPTQRYGDPPYPDDYNDQFLAEQIRRGTPAPQALALYTSFDVAANARADRIYVHLLRTQKKLDAECGFDCAGIIETYLRDEQLFQAPYHFSGRIARHLAATLSRRLGFPETYARRIETHLVEAPFVARYLPLHPSIVRHFGLRWVTEETRYPFLYEGGYTFEEYVLRFMAGTWSADLAEGIIDGERGLPEGKFKLIAGLKEAPRSGLGHHVLSYIMEREGDFAAALSHQRQAFALLKDYSMAARLGDLLKRAGDWVGAIAAFEEAARLDPVNPEIWAVLRDALLNMGCIDEAKLADRKAKEFSARLM